MAHNNQMTLILNRLTKYLKKKFAIFDVAKTVTFEEEQEEGLSITVYVILELTSEIEYGEMKMNL